MDIHTATEIAYKNGYQAAVDKFLGALTSSEENNTSDRLELFLAALAELTKKYSISIHGCGCCKSPWLEDGGNEVVADELVFISTTGQYEVKKQTTGTLLR